MTSLKTCFKCGVPQPISSFYKHARMADGHLNKCKSCTKLDVRCNYSDRRSDRVLYERERQKRPERRANKLAYQRKMRLNNPQKYKAWTALNNAVRDGRVQRLPCQECGVTEGVQAHHHDYSKPLDVRWLCHKHHRENEHGQRTGS